MDDRYKIRECTKKKFCKTAIDKGCPIEIDRQEGDCLIYSDCKQFEQIPGENKCDGCGKKFASKLFPHGEMFLCIECYLPDYEASHERYGESNLGSNFDIGGRELFSVTARPESLRNSHSRTRRVMINGHG